MTTSRELSDSTIFFTLANCELSARLDPPNFSTFNIISLSVSVQAVMKSVISILISDTFRVIKRLVRKIIQFAAPVITLLLVLFLAHYTKFA